LQCYVFPFVALPPPKTIFDASVASLKRACRELVITFVSVDPSYPVMMRLRVEQKFA